MCIYFEEFSVIINVVLIIITGSLALYTYKLYSTSKKSVIQQGDYYKATTRPFVSIVADKSFDLSNLKYSQDTKCYTFDINYFIKNYGSLPAEEVQLHIEVAQNKNFTFRKKYVPDQNSFSIFPNNQQAAFRDSFKYCPGEKISNFFLHICIYYQDMAGNPHHDLSIMLFHIYEKGEPSTPRLIKNIID